MIRAPFSSPEVLRRLQPGFASAPLRSLLLPGACEPDEVRAFVAAARFEKFDLADRGRYELAEPDAPALLRELRRFAQGASGRTLGRGTLRLQRFRRGGYALLLDDARTRLATGIEVTLDLSESFAGPPAVYSAGPDLKLFIPQSPGLAAVVERTPYLTRYDRYLPQGVGRKQVVRLRAAFVPA